ncbi:proline racemase family protein [Virgibacillus necropolis]|uniref:Proline racemase n=1 Tax=Virgibacillus necropolis TaxID=163877 RepID=A0A221MA66_9BACI|nr:proline racemase family protein [Virgibacillus necropolis]ASN04544.1 proline racemase [Virgibacillus necropolis]
MNFKKMISTVDLHVAGEPLRIITGGLPEIKGNTQPERRAYCIKNLDHIRKTLMNEPRGHHGMYGCIITPPATNDADFGVLFLHNEGWSTMCGHGIIAVITMVVETGKYEVNGNERKFVIDSPAGKVIAQVRCEGQEVIDVSFENVPSFVYKKDFPVKVDGHEFHVDIAFGGAFYAILDSTKLNLSVNSEDLADLQDWGMKIKKYVEANLKVEHPLQADLKDIYGVIFSDEPSSKIATLRNVTIFADRQIDRSPCGTGTSARVATLYERGHLNEGDTFVHESITGGLFKSDITSFEKVGIYNALIPSITGTASITGFHQFLIDSSDTMPEGFLL